MNVLIIGSGGREHALACKARASEKVSQVFVAPGNAGTLLEKNIQNVALDIEDFAKLADFVKQSDIELTIVGPEVPLVLGMVDYFNELGLPCFGPTKQAAQLEGSKSFAKEFLKKYDIPSAAYAVFTDTTKAKDYLKKNNQYPIVIKADGLAAGKGVIIAHNESEGFDAVNDMLSDNRFGDAGSRVVIEDFIDGEEVSFICIADGIDVLPMATSQDHKRRDDNDLGPNTGGMGAYSPAPLVDKSLHDRIMKTIIIPTLQGMLAEKIKYTGFLYAGLMIDEKGHPKVIEFNCRFGDPETQPIMMRLKSDMVSHCLAALNGTLKDEKAEWDDRVSLGVVLASKNYPENVNKGDIISGLNCDDDNEAVKVFHAGTKINNENQVITNGGRVLCVTSLADNIENAQKLAYQYCQKISWNNVFYRKDIGYKAVNRNQTR